ncbi:MAG: PIN domain-containing protein [Candidatus Aenigmarchaeota archaeon]|nr:PIN domain-containing protein [Candidatus Aenigmarchaeota archaeon]
MPYADTDFLMALIKPSDWLKQDAEQFLRKYNGSLWTSPVAIIESLLVIRKFGMDAKEVVVSLYELVDVPLMNRETALAAASFIQDEGMNVFDAFHAAFAMNDFIISSDDVFEKAGLRRIALK